MADWSSVMESVASWVSNAGPLRLPTAETCAASVAVIALGNVAPPVAATAAMSALSGPSLAIAQAP